MNRLVLLAAALALLGCDARRAPEPAAVEAPRPAPTFKASCSTPRLGVCTEYTDAAFVLGEELLKVACAETHGAWSPARCPPERRLGQCRLPATWRHYYPGGDLDFSAATAAKDCAELYQGSWAANRLTPTPTEEAP